MGAQALAERAQAAAMRLIVPGPIPGGLPVLYQANHGLDDLPGVQLSDRLITVWEFSAVERAAILGGANLVVATMNAGGNIHPFGMGVEGCDEDE